MGGPSLARIVSTSDVDVVIAGGGPSGCATALFLWHATKGARRPPRIVLIDKAHFPREKICAGAVGGRAERALEAIGVRVPCPGVVVHGLGVVTRDGKLAARHSSPIGRVVRRREFDAALLDEMRERGVDVRTGVALEGFERRGKTLVVATSAGILTTRVLVGADGVGSRVRRALGLGRGALYAQAVEVDTRWCDADTSELDMSGPDADTLWFDLRDRRYPGYGWTFPTVVGGESLACRGVYAVTHGLTCVNQRFEDVATTLSGELSRVGLDAIAPDRFKRFAERGLAAHEPTAKDGVLLVGEAAGIDPVLGEGIAQAILYGKAAGPYLARALERGDVAFGDWPRAFARSRIGVDLVARRLALPLVYGTARPQIERLVTSSSALARAGLCYFAGERVPRLELVRAALDGVRVAASR